MISTPTNETPTPLESEGKSLWPCPLLIADVDKPSPWLETAVFVDLNGQY